MDSPRPCRQKFIAVDPELWAEIKASAAAEGRTIGGTVRHAWSLRKAVTGAGRA